MNAIQPEIKKINRSWCIVAGVSQLARFRTEAAAKAAFEAKKSLWLYWAGSASVSVENSPKKIIYA